MAEIIDIDGDLLTVESEFGSLWLTCSSSLGAGLNPEMARQLRREIDLYLSATPVVALENAPRVRRPVPYSRTRARMP